LIDASRDNSRVANWTDGSGWRFMSVTGSPGAVVTDLLLFFASAGDLYVDDVSVVAGTQAGVGSNYVANGGFETGALGPWRTVGGYTGSVVSSSVAFNGNYSLHIVGTGVGSPGSAVIQTHDPLDAASTYTFSLWYLPSTNGTGLNFRYNNAFRTISAVNYRPIAASRALRTQRLRPCPHSRRCGSTKFSPTMSPVSPITRATAIRGWNFIIPARAPSTSPAGILRTITRTLRAGRSRLGHQSRQGQFLVVWLDGEPAESNGSALHTSFRVSPATGSLALVFPFENRNAVLDYINYTVVGERSIGYFPDGVFGPRDSFFVTTPGAANDNTCSAVTRFHQRMDGRKHHLCCGPGRRRLRRLV
jgi:hypothetical protein